MNEQSGFFDVPRARNSWRDGRLVRDPETSRKAAEGIPLSSLTAAQRRVLTVLQLARRPLSDEQIVAEVRRLFSRSASASGIRSRRSDLVKKGLIVPVTGQQGLTRSGQFCTLWRIADRPDGA
jgi:hypothetical protein